MLSLLDPRQSQAINGEGGDGRGYKSIVEPNIVNEIENASSSAPAVQLKLFRTRILDRHGKE